MNKLISITALSISLILCGLGGDRCADISAAAQAQTNNDPRQTVEYGLKKKLADCQKQNGYTHPQTIHVMWELANFYLDTEQFAQAEGLLRYINDATRKNSKNAPISMTDISTAYRRAVRGMSHPKFQSVTNSSQWASLAPQATSASAIASASNQQKSGIDPRAWFLAGDDPRNYDMGWDSGCVSIRTRTPSPTGFGTVMQNLNVRPYNGRRVRFSAMVRTVDSGKTQLWMRVDGPTPGYTMALDNMDNRPISGNTGWARYECVLDVPFNATGIALGIIQCQAGQSWIDQARIEEVDKNTPSTATF